MVNKHRKRCLISVVREMQIKTVRYHYTSVTIDKSRKTDHTQHW